MRVYPVMQVFEKKSGHASHLPLNDFFSLYYVFSWFTFLKISIYVPKMIKCVFKYAYENYISGGGTEKKLNSIT